MNNKPNKLTYIKDLYRDKNYNMISLYKCECGNECPAYKYSVNNNNTRSCGCLKNQDKRKPFPVEIIPVEYTHLIKPDVCSISLGNHHHRQWCSEVICLFCGTSKLQRNERVIYCIKKYGYVYVCQKCVSREIMNKKIDPAIILEAEEKYMQSNISWSELAKSYNLKTAFLYNKCNGKLLTKVRRLARRKQSVERMENELLQQEKAFIEKQKNILEEQKQKLSQWENNIKLMVGEK